MSEEIQNALAALEKELAEIETNHRAELEQHRAALVLSHHTSLSDELKRLEVEAKQLRAKIETLNRRIDATTSSRWETHAFAAGLALILAAAIFFLLVGS